MQVLIVEDEIVSRTVLGTVLRRIPDVELIETEDGAEAWELLAEGLAPDLCIVDFMMPRMNGLELLANIRQCETTARLRVAFCTANGERRTVLRAAQLRVDAYLLKPFQPKAIQDLVAAARQALCAQPLNEEPATVCRRLEIDAVTFRESRRLLFEQLHRLEEPLEESATREEAAGAVTAMRETCSRLGYHRLANSIVKLERAIQRPANAASVTVVRLLRTALLKEVATEQPEAGCPVAAAA